MKKAFLNIKNKDLNDHIVNSNIFEITDNKTCDLYFGDSCVIEEEIKCDNQFYFAYNKLEKIHAIEEYPYNHFFGFGQNFYKELEENPKTGIIVSRVLNGILSSSEPNEEYNNILFISDNKVCSNFDELMIRDVLSFVNLFIPVKNLKIAINSVLINGKKFDHTFEDDLKNCIKEVDFDFNSNMIFNSDVVIFLSPFNPRRLALCQYNHIFTTGLIQGIMHELNQSVVNGLLFPNKCLEYISNIIVPDTNTFKSHIQRFAPGVNENKLKELLSMSSLLIYLNQYFFENNFYKQSFYVSDTALKIRDCLIKPNRNKQKKYIDKEFLKLLNDINELE